MNNQSRRSRRQFTPEFKLKVVLESMQRDTTIATVCSRYNVSSSVLNRWRKDFAAHAAEVFTDKRDHAARARSQGYEPGQSPDELKRVIGDLTVQVEVLKKVEGLLP
jgi:transposase